MRMVDADALDEFLFEAQKSSMLRGDIFRFGVLSNVRANIMNAPTIAAIPVEWLEAHKTISIEDWGEDPVTVGAALMIWQKEQEAR